MSYYLYFSYDNKIVKSLKPFIEHTYNNEKYYQLLSDIYFSIKLDTTKKYKYKIASDNNILLDWLDFELDNFTVDEESGELVKKMDKYIIMFAYYMYNDEYIITTPTIIEKI